MKHSSNHAAIHTTKGLTASPISKYFFFWIINDMGNQNRWCCSTSPQQKCILPCCTPTLLTVLGAPVFQAPQAFLKALLENFPGKTTREQSQHNEGSRAVQHVAFCMCAGRTTCTSFVDSSEKAWPQTRWPSSCTVVFPLSHQVITTPPLPVQFQACIVYLLHKQLHFQSQTTRTGLENPA